MIFSTFFRPESKSIYNIPVPLRINYLTRLRLGFCHLKKHKFRQNFLDSVDLFCNNIELINHFLLHCPNFHTQQKTLFDKINDNSGNISAQNDDSITKILLLGKQNFDDSLNNSVVRFTIDHILATEGFKGLLFNNANSV